MKLGLDNDSNRVEWIIETLKKIEPGKKILDAGAGELRFKKYCSHLDYVSQDFGGYDGSGEVGLQTGTWDQTKLDIVCDIIDIPVPDNSFDAILCIEVFEHISTPLNALKEFARILKPGGKLILTAPFCSLTHFAPFHFYTGFSTYFYTEHLEKNNFDIIEMVQNGNYFAYLAQELRRLNPVAKKYTGKSTSIQAKIAIQVLLKELESLNKKDTGSKELLNYGIHVFAEKKA